MKYELFVAMFVLYQLSVYVFMRRWVNVRNMRIAMLIGDRRLHSVQHQDPSVMTHARWRRKVILAIVILTLILIFAMVLGVGTSIEEFSWPWFMVGVVIVLALAWAPWGMVAEAYGIAMILDNHSITRLSPWSRERTIKWSEVESVTYSWFWAWFTIRSPAGSIHVTTVIEGLEKFAQNVMSQVPRERIYAWDWISKALQGPFRW